VVQTVIFDEAVRNSYRVSTESTEHLGFQGLGWGIGAAERCIGNRSK
jgi:hypothetical protein